MKIRYKLKEKFAEIAEKPFHLDLTDMDKFWWRKCSSQFWWNLCLNESEAAIQLLEKNQEKINWYPFSRNKYGIKLMQENREEIRFSWLLRHNENVHEIIKDMSLEEICKVREADEATVFIDLSMNPGAGAIEILDKFHDKQHLFKWEYLSANPYAMHLLKANIKKIHWSELSKNKNARDLLLANRKKINWKEMSRNENMIDELEKNLHRVDWANLSTNPNALPILKRNLEKIVCPYLLQNKSQEAFDLHMELFPDDDYNYTGIAQHPCIFEIDYVATKKEMQESGLAEDIISTALHPNRVAKWIELGFDDF